MNRSPLLLAALLASVWCSAAELYRFKEGRTLSLNPGLLAVKTIRSNRQELAFNATPYGNGDYSLVDTSGWSEAQRDGFRQAWAADGGYVTPVYRDLLGGPFFPTAQILVEFTADESMIEAENWLHLRFPQATIAPLEGLVRGFRVRFPHGDGEAILAAAAELAKMRSVVFAEPDMSFTGRSAFTPNDQLFGQSWHLKNSNGFDLNATPAWDITQGLDSVKTVIIDVGVEQNHPDINQLPGMDFTGQGSGGGPFNSFDNHGTAVAGCVSEKINNSIGTAGIAPNTMSLGARCFISINANGSWNADYSWTGTALLWAEAQGARVSNNSNYYGGSSSYIEQIYSETRDRGMIHFASAGNNGTNVLGYPASLPTVNAVAALQSSGTRASFSQYGVGLDFIAPGANIISSDRTGANGYVTGDYAAVSGTSFASPLSAGVAALGFSANPFISQSKMQSILQTTARDFGTAGYDTNYGWGMPDAAKVVTEAGKYKINLSLVTPIDGANLPSTLSVRYRSTDGRLIGSNTLTLQSGTYQGLAPDGAYRLVVTLPSYLKRVVPVNNSAFVLSTSVALSGGDIDNDGAITVFDYGILSDYFDLSSSDATWNTVGGNGARPSDADLDRDGTVSIFDYSILSDNFDRGADTE